MCIILPVSHIPCTHTVSIWQHCIDATRSGVNGLKPCWNVRQHERAILTRNLCENCGGARFFARRGGVAERGNGSPPAIPDEHKRNDDDEADDSGYHSDVIHEEEEPSDCDELPLSPRATAPPKVQWKQPSRGQRKTSNYPTSNGKPSWSPNLKRALVRDDGSGNRARRDSMDSMISKFDGSIWYDSKTEDVAIRNNVDDTTTATERITITPKIRRPKPPKRRASTLLHPSSPPVETVATMQTAKAFTSPRVVHIRKPSSEIDATITTSKQFGSGHSTSTSVKSKPGYETGSSTSSRSHHTDAPRSRPAGPDRKISTLLHPSCPPDGGEIAAQKEIILSIPPRRPAMPVRRNSTLLHPSPPSLLQRRRPDMAARRLPTLLKVPPAFSWEVSTGPIAPPASRQRRESILHSCFSDVEDEGFDEDSYYAANVDVFFDRDFVFASDAAALESDTDSFDGDHGTDRAEGAILANTARIARASRHKLPSRIKGSG